MGNLDIRQSQLVMSSGVGGIIDFPQDSLMLVGLDFWPYITFHRREELKDHYQIKDARLQRWLAQKLRRPIDFFLKPIEAPSTGQVTHEHSYLFQSMPFIRFPTWYWCPRCHLLHQLGLNTPVGDQALYCEGVHSRGKLPPCCTLTGKGPRKGKVRLLPSRFVVACEAGHIDDFPYVTLIPHAPGCEAASGDIFLSSTGGLGLSGLRLSCAGCGAYRFMSNALAGDSLAEALGHCCSARRPWLPNAQYAPPCGKSPRLAQRGSVNLYAAKYDSAIYIPDKARYIQEKLTNPNLQEDLNEAYDPKTDTFDPGLLRSLVRRTHIPEEEIQKFLKTHRPEEPTPPNLQDFLYEEYAAFLKPLPNQDRDDFDPLDENIKSYSEAFGRYFDRVVLLKKLRETRVFTGFTRLGQDLEEPPISVKTVNWLPGIEVRGEGIFLRLRAERLEKWEAGLPKEAWQRIHNLHPSGFAPVFRYVMIHTLAHLLIRQLSFDCGYSSTALRERLYVGQGDGWNMHGLLIYTASGDSEGTMGGLVRQGRPGKLEPSLQTALAIAEVCSNDPLCMESNGQGYQNRNLAACHACALIPETACEAQNQYLDRRLLIGDPVHRKSGFFNVSGAD